MAVIANWAERPMLLQPGVFELTTMALTPRCDTLTRAPAVNKGGAKILPGVETAARLAPFSDRPIPVCRFGAADHDKINGLIFVEPGCIIGGFALHSSCLR
jgi:hypothetical protein